MILGSLTAACLLLVAGATPADVSPLKQRDFQLPIHLDPARQQDVFRLILWVSTDQGQNWNQVEGIRPDPTQEMSFSYTAPADGIYWFAIQTIDRNSKAEPPTPTANTVQQKILIDTAPPEFRQFTAVRNGEEVAITWDIFEANPDLKTLKIEYRPRDAREEQWFPVDGPAAPDVRGTCSFRPRTAGPLSVRMELSDTAGNVAHSVLAEVAGTVVPVTGQAPSPRNEDRSFDPSRLTHETPPQPLDRASIPPPSPPGSPLTIPGAASLPGGFAEPAGSQDNRVVFNATGGTGRGPIASSQPGTQVHQAHFSPLPEPAGAPPRTPSALPPLQMVNKRQVQLEYEVARYGPSGLGSVDVFVTRDEGRTWQPAEFDASQAADMPPPEGSQTSGPLHRSLTIKLPGEGLYGFYLVVKSGAGRGLRPPLSGDVPHVRILLDETAPICKLWAPMPDSEQRDAVLLNWVASDPNGNLTATPITLDWAERSTGPWNKIGPDELPNTGRYSWKLPPGGIPGRVYLRLTVRDAAGNTTVVQSDEPQSIDLTEPVFKITGVKPGGQP